jgi:predicted RNase H-like HicB family nuclease
MPRRWPAPGEKPLDRFRANAAEADKSPAGVGRQDAMVPGLSGSANARSCATIGIVTRVVHVPCAVEQDEDGVWCASAQLRPGDGAVGDGPTLEAAIADLRGALEVLLAETGPPDELTLTLNVA